LRSYRAIVGAGFCPRYGSIVVQLAIKARVKRFRNVSKI
jgi:hypothetical protein